MNQKEHALRPKKGPRHAPFDSFFVQNVLVRIIQGNSLLTTFLCEK